MATAGKAAFGLYRTRQEVKNAIASLQSVGIKGSDCFVFTPEQRGSQDFVYQQQTSMMKGVKMGAIIGGLVFALVGSLIAFQVIQMPGLEMTFGRGLLTIIAGLVLGIVVGSACGALVGIGTPRPAGRRYANYIKEGGLLLSVHFEKDEDRPVVTEIMKKSGGHDVSSLDPDEAWKEIYTKEFNVDL